MDGGHSPHRAASVACLTTIPAWDHSEAEAIEEAAETAQNQASFGEEGEEGEAGNLMTNVDENTRAIILINATGVIQMANKVS
jgi:hypothetical protein